MATTEPQRDAAGTDDAAQKKKRSPWLWVSIGLAAAVIGLLIWGINSQSDLDNAQKDVQDLQSQMDQGQETAGALVASVKDVFNDLKAQLGSVNEDVAASEQQVKDADAAAAKAEQDAAAAEKQAGEAKSKTEKANAEADQAKAEAKAATSELEVAAGCAKSYVSAFGALVDGHSSSDVKQQLETITADCKTALAGT
jgi:chromosome segregation ATPase